MLDAARLRADFPIFEQVIHGKPLAYLNSAATSQKPRQVLDAMTEFYETSYSNVHRGVYTLGERATAGLEGAREKVRAFVNAPTEREIIFVRNATEGLNLVAYAYGLARLGRATSCSRPSSSTTRTSSPGSTSRTAPAPTSGSSRSTTTATCCSTRSPTSRT